MANTQVADLLRILRRKHSNYDQQFDQLKQALADAEQRGYERGRETERAEVVNYLRQPEHDAADLAHNIETGKHLAKGGE